MIAGEGSARVIEGADAQDINRRIRAKYLVPGARDAIERAWAPIDDVALELSPRTWRSWTGTVLHREAIRELGTETAYEEAWLPDD